MSHVAKEMQRQEFHVPLLIGGATTSRAHTALKIEPHYKSPTVWVKDASRAVGVAQSLISKELVDEFLARVRAEYAEIRERHKDRERREEAGHARQGARAALRRRLGELRRRRTPRQPGITVFDDYPLAELVERIDWTPFFNAWELSGRFPAILDDAIVGTQASELYRDARAMLDRIVAEKWLTARGVIGFWPRACGRRRCRACLDGPRGNRDAALPAPAGRQAGRSSRFLPRRFRRAEISRRRRLDRRIRGHGRHRHRSASRSASSASTTTIRRSC